MALAPHQVIAEFIGGGVRIKAGGTWTPPDQATADRLIKAKCIKAPKVSVITPDPAPAGSAPSSAAVTPVSAASDVPQPEDPDEATSSRPRSRRGRKGG